MSRRLCGLDVAGAFGPATEAVADRGETTRQHTSAECALPDAHHHSHAVNVACSLASSSPLDKTIKNTLMSDLFHLVNAAPCAEHLRVPATVRSEDCTPHVTRAAADSASRKPGVSG
eukprot:212493-Pleurochrysis_carterae.AAC.5